jgi:hypothetical protein
MADLNTSDVQAQVPLQPDDYKPRYDGLLRKTEELTLTNRSQAEQLLSKASEIERLTAQLASKEVEKTAAVGERDRKYEEALKSNLAQDAELNDLRGMKAKIKIMKEMGQPQLLQIIDRIPNMADEEVLRGVMKDFSDFANDLVSAREKQLLSGTTPAFGTPPPTKPTPANPAAWEKLLNSLPAGSKDHSEAMDAYWQWTNTQK